MKLIIFKFELYTDSIPETLVIIMDSVGIKVM